jgi:hypothetical protein
VGRGGGRAPRHVAVGAEEEERLDAVGAEEEERLDAVAEEEERLDAVGAEEEERLVAVGAERKSAPVIAGERGAEEEERPVTSLLALARRRKSVTVGVGTEEEERPVIVGERAGRRSGVVVENQQPAQRVLTEQSLVLHWNRIFWIFSSTEVQQMMEEARPADGRKCNEGPHRQR